MSENPSQSPSDDQSAQQWREVFEASETGLRAFLSGRLSQSVDVEDCLQAVYIKMVESGQDVLPAARRAWLFRVAANEAAGTWRRKATSERVLEKQARGLSEVTEDDAADKVILDETTEKLRTALDGLPDRWREVVRLRIYENLTFQQIADRLNIPLGTALTQMRRALERLRSEIETDEPS